MMKRNREDLKDITAMANCLVLLSAGCGGGGSGDSDRVFTCKTCDRQFTSFQALGGHRASHKKPRVMMDGDSNHPLQPTSSPPKPKTHECSICGLEFPIGQALGGHMRRHRSTLNLAHQQIKKHPVQYPFLSLSPPRAVKKLPPSNRTVLCLDLNLTPLENKFVSGKAVPAVDFC